MKLSFKIILAIIAAVAAGSHAASGAEAAVTADYATEKAGMIFAHKNLPARVFAYITQPSKQVDKLLGMQLDILFGNDEIQEAFKLLETKPTDKETLQFLQAVGFIFLGQSTVFKLKYIPGYVFKVADKHSHGTQAFASHVGRLWYGDFVRSACALKQWNIAVPEKWIHFMTTECACESLYAIIVVHEYDLTDLQQLYYLSEKHANYIEPKLKIQLRYPDDIDYNVYGQEESNRYLLVDTETMNLINFDTCFPPETEQKKS